MSRLEDFLDGRRPGKLFPKISIYPNKIKFYEQKISLTFRVVSETLYRHLNKFGCVVSPAFLTSTM